MNYLKYDVVIIGAGAAGLSAAAKCAENQTSTLVVDRDSQPGGVLRQCIHNGFGLHYFKEELTGPEYAAKLVQKVGTDKTDFLFGATVMQIVVSSCGKKQVIIYSGKDGVITVNAGAIILAMGCRERNRGNIGIPGDRMAGVFTAGLAQRLLNIDGCIPGKNAVIVGSGDIGLIMARRLSWCGVNVKAIIEIMPFPAGLSRNIAQCVEDFKIPLHLATVVTGIFGAERVERITMAPLIDGQADLAKETEIECDTVLFSVGLIPENELSSDCGILLDPVTGGARVDSSYQTNLPGIFACGNVLHVHDLVDFVSEEAEFCAGQVLKYLSNGELDEDHFGVTTGENLRYIVPHSCRKGRLNKFYMRPTVILPAAELIIEQNGKHLASQVFHHVKPSEMLSLTFSPPDSCSDSPLTFKLIGKDHE